MIIRNLGHRKWGFVKGESFKGCVVYRQKAFFGERRYIRKGRRMHRGIIGATYKLLVYKVIGEVPLTHRMKDRNR